ncbi:MAG: M23 family metallopeptidase [Dehalococcoidia bacterium]|nr:M23 family metallopeptidase [Dehalococcoidia bacterium]
MRRGIRRPRATAPWYARTEARLAAVVVALLLLAAAAVIVRSDDAPTSDDIAVRPTSPTATVGASATTVAAATGPSGTPSASGTPATLAPTPVPLLLDLRPAAVGQGETILVWVHAPGAFSVTLELRDDRFTLLPEGEVFWGVVGIPLDAALGAAELTVTARSSSGEIRESLTEGYEIISVDRPVDHITLTEEVASVLTPEAAEAERALRARLFSEFDRGRRWSTFFRIPTAGPMSSQFGQGRSYNGGPVGGFHTGADIAAAEGASVVATGPARVAWVGEMPIRGISVILDHGAGVKSGYHHLSAAAVVGGDVVEGGQLIGQVGATGLATGPHLHWELTVWGVNVNPLTWTLKDFTP